MSDPKLIIRTAWRPKKGHRPDEYEDAFAVSPSPLPFRAAVADGATESMFSGGWARALVEAYIAGSEAKAGAGASNARPVPDSPLAEAIRQARASWTPGSDPRWYVVAKAAEGAHAAVLGLEIRADGWHAEAVGDCCLFHVRGPRLLRSWPMTSAEAFSHRPPLVSSRSATRGTSADRTAEIETASGTWHSGDAFLLATDALAQWLLRAEPISDHLDPSNRADVNLDALLDSAAASGMRNDDATALAVLIEST